MIPPARSRLARNVAANLGGQLALLVTGLVAVKLVFGRLGPDALGILLFAQTLNVVLAGVLDLGVSSITVREVAAHAEDEPRYIHDLIRTATTLYWAGFLVVAGSLLLAAPWIARHWIGLHAIDVRSATSMLQILGVASFTALPRALYTSLFRGLQRMTFNNAIDAGTGLLQQLGTVLILAAGGSLFAVVNWLAAIYFLGLLAYLLLLSRLLPVAALLPGWSLAVVRRNARFSAHMMSISALSVAHTYVDKLVVSKLLPIATLGPYAFAASIVGRGALLTNAIADASYPSLSGLARLDDRTALRAHYHRLQELVSYLTVPLYAGIVYLSLPLFNSLFGAAVSRSLLLPVAILCLGSYLNATLTVPYVYSLAVGKPQITSSLSLQAVFVVVPVTIASVAILGIAGASFGYLAYHLYLYAVGVPRYCRECLEIAPSSWYRPVAAILTLAASTYGLGWLIASRLGRLGLPILALAFAIASVAFVLAASRMIHPSLRELTRTLLGRPPAKRFRHAA